MYGVWPRQGIVTVNGKALPPIRRQNANLDEGDKSADHAPSHFDANSPQHRITGTSLAIVSLSAIGADPAGVTGHAI
ncbi:hypothetical protein [Teredinibacter franksiae]|uniref:hypothetical protein n=1 Tax=Teredinibacter franksiae TaxID=2761453 RepID=UPI0016264551|nr:hypothetical protein [Teredinibacter franksiae]